MSVVEIPQVGYLFNNLLSDYFVDFTKAHMVQDLTESNKPDISYRKGVYLSEVSDDGEFNVLRCSTNLQGPTESFTDLDREIIGKVNTAVKTVYPDAADLNHVLAQIYYNFEVDKKQKKARIPAHSDKTEDMPDNGLIAFCTFYNPESLKNKHLRITSDDIYYKNTSALTRLRFTNKQTKEQLEVPLMPNSVLVINLETNAKFTHETVPPNLDSKDVPERLGYVIRSSKQKAKFTDRTYLMREDQYVPLRMAEDKDVEELKKLYMDENQQVVRPKYGFIDFSLNLGDYHKPKRC